MKVTAITKFKQGDLHKALRDLNWTQKEFARRCSLSVTTIGDIINLKRKPSQSMREQIRNVLWKAGQLVDIEKIWPENFVGFKKSLFLEQTRDIETSRLLTSQSTPYLLPSSTKYDFSTDELLSILSPNEKNIITDRFYENMTFCEISKKHGKSKQRINEIIENSIKKLKRCGEKMLNYEELYKICSICGEEYLTFDYTSKKCSKCLKKAICVDCGKIYTFPFSSYTTDKYFISGNCNDCIKKLRKPKPKPKPKLRKPKPKLEIYIEEDCTEEHTKEIRDIVNYEFTNYCKYCRGSFLSTSIKDLCEKCLKIKKYKLTCQLCKKPFESEIFNQKLCKKCDSLYVCDCGNLYEYTNNHKECSECRERKERICECGHEKKKIQSYCDFCMIENFVKQQHNVKCKINRKNSLIENHCKKCGDYFVFSLEGLPIDQTQLDYLNVIPEICYNWCSKCCRKIEIPDTGRIYLFNGIKYPYDDPTSIAKIKILKEKGEAYYEELLRNSDIEKRSGSASGIF